MNDVPVASTDEALLHYLRGRVPADLVRRRLELERRGPEPVLDFRNRAVHPENWSGFAPLLRMVLRLTGLYERGRRNALAPTVTERSLAVRGLPGGLGGYRVLQISDPHLDISSAFVDALVATLDGVQADLCVLTGDFRFRTDGSSDAALQALERLAGVFPAPAYAVLGNHDSLTTLPRMEALGIRVLINEGVALARGGGMLWLAGVDDPHYFGLHDLQAAQQGRPSGAPSLLLAHSPELYAAAADAGYQAMLCGHTHGGQICLPGGRPILTNARCSRRFCGGAWAYGGMQGYTSVGAGSSVLDVRFNSPAEVVIHILEDGVGHVS